MVAAHLTLTAVLFGVLLPDYLLTCVVAVLERQPRLLLLGVFFPFMRMLDACIGLYAIPAAWLSRSSGRWKSPARRVVDTEDVPAVPSAVEDQPAVRARPAPGLAAARAGLGTGGAGRVPVRDESSTGSTGAGPTPHSPARVAEASHVSG